MCEVNVVNGELLRFETDLFYPGYIPVELNRLYRSSSVINETLGFGWSNSVDVFLRRDGDRVVFHDETGEQTPLEGKPGDKELADPTGALVFRLESNLYVLDDENDRQHHFSPFVSGQAFGHRVLTTDRPHGNVVRYTYDRDGKVDRIIDTLGREIGFVYDRDGHVTEVTVRASGTAPRIVRRYAYSPAGDLVAVIDSLRRVKKYEYEDHLLVRELGPRGTSIYWAYDNLRRCVRTWRDGNVMSRDLSFDNGGRRTKVVNSHGFVTVYEYDENKNVVSEVDPLGNVTSRTYDAAGSLVAESGPEAVLPGVRILDESSGALVESSPNGSMFYQFFDARGRRIRVVDEKGNEWTTSYDDAGRIVGETEPGGATWAFECDPRGFVKKMSTPSGGTLHRTRTTDSREEHYWDDIGPVERLRYDSFGNVIEISDGSGIRYVFKYDAADRLVAIVNPDGSRRLCEHDDNDNIVAIVDEAGGVTRYEYDAADRPIKETAPDGTASVLSWDTEGNLTEIRNPRGDIARLSYDPCGRLLSMEAFDGRVMRTTYDDLSRCISVKIGESTFHYEHNAEDIVAEILPDGSRNEFSWQNGFLSSAANRAGRVERDFDSGMRLVSERFGDWEAQLEYDVAGRHIRTRLSTGRVIEYRHDARDRIVSIEDTLLGSHRFEYNLSDVLTAWEAEGVLRVEYSYDDQGRKTGAKALRAEGTVLLTYEWHYDSRDLRLRERRWQSGGGEAVTIEYRHDARERVIRRTRDGKDDEWYTYDSNDNISVDSVLGGRDIGSGDRVYAAGPVRLEYDTLGRTVVRDGPEGRRTFEYDHNDRLTTITFPDGSQARYGYDALGRRVSKQARGASVFYGWIEDDLLCAHSRETAEDFLFFPGCWIPLAWRRGDDLRLFVCDPMGAPVEMIDKDGRIVWTRDTTLWGAPRETSRDAEFCPIGFAGQFRDAESGLHYNYHRYYDPFTGRFLTPDPLEIEGGGNVYTAMSNPLAQIDPFGLFVAVLAKRCDWSDAQKEAFAKKVMHYEKLIKDAQEKGKPGHKVSPCYSNRSARDVWEKDCGKKPPKQKKPKGKGASADCTKDIDHSTDKQMGGKNDCKNLKPLNSSVNRSAGSQMAREIRKHIKEKGKKFAFLQAVKVQPKKCPPTKKRTKNCI